jgi:3-deoxy-D-manno-octulosonic acid (KDO) 8-phosphate synthase
VIETIAKAGIAVGVDGIFIETHLIQLMPKVMVPNASFRLFRRIDDQISSY